MLPQQCWTLVAFLAATAPAWADDAVAIEKPRWLRGVDLPSEAAGRIAASVDDLIVSLATTGRECLREVGSDWSQWSRLEFAGPSFLSVRVNADFFCAGAAHPDQVSLELTFDLTTGQRVEWSRLLGALPMTEDGTAVAGSPELRAAFLKAITPIPKECETPLKDPSLRFDLSLDAERGAVAASPNGLAYAEKACGDIAYLTIDALAPLLPSDVLMSALTTPARP